MQFFSLGQKLAAQFPASQSDGSAGNFPLRGAWVNLKTVFGTQVTICLYI